MTGRRPLRLALLVTAVLCGMLAAVAAGPGSAQRPVATQAAQATPAASPCTGRSGTSRVSFASGGKARSALVHMPRGRGGRLPLVLALHGAYGTGAFMERYSGLSKLADRSGFAVAYPDSDGPRWKISAAEAPVDVEFLDTLIDRLVESGCVDENRVSVVGVSNGGGMAARLACEADERLAGLVSVAGGYSSLPRCQARRPLSVLEIHGTADPVVPYYGRAGTRAGDVVGWLTRWVARDGCRPSVRRSAPARNVVRLDWGPCRAGTAVAHLRLIGGTHAWPGADPPDRGPSFGVSAGVEAWRFLKDRRRAQAVDPG